MPTPRYLAAVLALAGGYAVAVRPRLLRWGATDEEVRRPFPGADLVPGGKRSATMAVTIDAPPPRVWPWLVQMGVDRAGWYSWDRLDNFGRRSAKRIHPEWQAISVGDRLAAKPDGSEWWAVAALEPERFLGLRMSLDLRGRPFDPAGAQPHWYTDSLWGFLLEELPGGRTRLVVSGYWTLRPRWLQPVTSVVFLEPSHWIMQTRQFANLQRHAEPDSARAGQARPQDVRTAPPARTFRSPGWRVGNATVGVLARAGIGPFHLLTTRGRRTGRPHTNPVVIVEQDGRSWLVAAYGPVSWVHNARAAGRVSLRRGRDTRDYAIREVPAGEAGPVLKRYVGIATRTRAYFQASKDSPVEDFVSEAHRHPVFELIPLSTNAP